MEISEHLLSETNELKKLLEAENLDFVKKIMEDCLTTPLSDIFSRPKKNIRPLLVSLGQKLGTDKQANQESLEVPLKIASEIIEAIHTGSLIVDDIQDGSLTRRNTQTLHLKYGLPKALNAGNWLYFWALKKIEELPSSPLNKLDLTRACINLMAKAHLGQAIDLGTPLEEIPQAEVENVCKSSMYLKTSTLMNLALTLGASLNQDVSFSDELKFLGNKLGLVLQIYDDIGNYLNSAPENHDKYLEDLRLRRPGHVWAQASQLMSEKDYTQLLSIAPALKIDNSALLALHDLDNKYALTENLLKIAKLEIQNIREFSHKTWQKSHREELKLLEKILNKLENSYVKN